MTTTQLHPGFASLDLHGASVMLHDDESYRGHPWYDALRKEGLARGVGAELRFRVVNVDDAYRTAVRLGAIAIQGPADYEGTRECQVMGPDGYLFSLWQVNASRAELPE